MPACAVPLIVVRGPAFDGDVRERAVAIVAIENRGSRIRRDVDVRPAIAVQVERRARSSDSDR